MQWDRTRGRANDDQDPKQPNPKGACAIRPNPLPKQGTNERCKDQRPGKEKIAMAVAISMTENAHIRLDKIPMKRPPERATMGENI